MPHAMPHVTLHNVPHVRHVRHVSAPHAITRDTRHDTRYDFSHDSA